VWELVLSGVGVLFPSTQGLGFGWLKSAVQGALRGGSSVLRGIGSGALAVGRTALSPTALTGLAKQGVTVLPELIVGAGSTAFRAIRSIPGTIGRTTASVPSLIDSAGGFVKGTWNAGVTAVHGDFVQVTAQAGGMASKLGTYTVVNTGRAFDLAVSAVTPLSYSEIASLGYGGAFHMAFVERGLNMMSVRGAGVTSTGAHAALAGLDLTEPGAARMVEAAAPDGLLAPAAGLATHQGLDAVPDLGAVRGLGTGHGLSAVRGGTEQGLGVGQSRTALPDNVTARLSQPGRSAPEPADAGKTGGTVDLVDSGTQGGAAQAASLDTASGRLTELDQSLGLGRTESGLLVPADHASGARGAPGGGGRPQYPLLPGLDDSPLPGLPHGDFQVVTGADDALTVRVGDAAGAPATAGPTLTSRVSSGAAGEVRVGAADDTADAHTSLSPTARVDARNSALDLLVGGRTGSGDAVGTGSGVAGGIGRVAESVPVAGRAGRACGQEALESAGAPSAAAAGRPGALDAARLDTAGRAASFSSSSGFTPVGLHEAARLQAPGGQKRLHALTARQTVAHRLDTTAEPVRPAASQATRLSRVSAANRVSETADPHAPTAVEPTPSAEPAPPARQAPAHPETPSAFTQAPSAAPASDDLIHPTSPHPGTPDELQARAGRWNDFRTTRDAQSRDRFAMAEQLTSHTSALDSDIDAALVRLRQDDLVGGTYLSDAKAVERAHTADADGASGWAGARYAGAVASAVRIGATAASACGTVVSVSLPAGDTPDGCPPVSPLHPEQDLLSAPPGQLGNCPGENLKECLS
jgi:hypothetical protein